MAASCPKITFPTIPPVNYACSPTSASFDAKLMPLIAGNAKIIVTVKSSVSGVTLRLPEIEVKSGVKSLSEFDLVGILQIMILAAIILILSKKIF